MRWSTVVLALAAFVGLRCEAEGSATLTTTPSRYYVVGLVGSTYAYHPPAGPWDGFQHDFTGNFGVGRFVGDKWALELDFGATWVRGRYTSAALTPGALWLFHRKLYGAARLIVQIDPEADLVLYPGLGVAHTFRNGLAPLVEVNVARSLDRRDWGVTLTIGLLFSSPR